MQQFTPIEYIKISIANSYGLDKKPWEERIDFVNTHSTPGLLDLSKEASEPMMMVKGVNALVDALNGVPSGYMCNLDMTCSGIQLFSILAGCKKSAARVNLIDTGNRENVYSYMGDIMGVPGSDLKKTVMTTMYSSTAMPKSIFGEGEMLDKYYETMYSVLPGAMSVKDMIESCVSPEAEEYSFTMPDGFEVVYKVKYKKSSKIEVQELEKATFTYVHKVLGAKEDDRSLAAHVAHACDSYIVREATRRAHDLGIELLTIHDCYFCRPQHMQTVRVIVLDIMRDMAQMDLLQNIMRDLTGNCELVIEKDSDDLHVDMRSAEYFLS